MARRLPSNLPALLRAQGIPVVEEPGWLTRGRDFQRGIYGLMQHHWGSPAAGSDRVLAGHCYPRSSGGLRSDSRINCNIFSDRGTGAIHLIAAGAANYASCYGNPTVLEEVRTDTFPGGTAASRGLTSSTICGNNYFVNMEAEHAGDGSPMPEFQEQAITLFWSVLIDELGLSVYQLIGHNEWTARKIDPRWNGPGSRMPVLRTMVDDILNGVTPPPPPPTDGDPIVTQLPTLHQDDGYDNPTKGGQTALNVFVQKMQAVLAVMGFIAARTFNDDHQPDGKFGPGTEAALKDFQVSAGLNPDGVCGELTWTALLLNE